jgi:RNA polymerase sigma factor (sigma-70 family)
MVIAPLLFPLTGAFTVSDRTASVSAAATAAGGRTRLFVASLPRSQKAQETISSAFENIPPSSIDNELSAQNPDPISAKTEFMSEIQSILDDGQGHINKELAACIWTWENDNLNPQHNNPFPASKLKYSTRDGLRLVDSIAREMGEETTDGTRYNDLVQEGVVALMKSMAIWNYDDEGDFESFAIKEIQKSMKRVLRETSDGVGVLKMNIDMLKKSVSDLEKKPDSVKKPQALDEAEKVELPEPCDQIVKPLREALLDENPTPDEIALSDMIRNDISHFLERTLSETELQIVRMRFGLHDEVGTSLGVVSKNLQMDPREVEEIEGKALDKLRTSFSNDYIGAYLDDDDHLETEVSL